MREREKEREREREREREEERGEGDMNVVEGSPIVYMYMMYLRINSYHILYEN